MKTKMILALILWILSISCVSAEKGKDLPQKYTIIENHFEYGEHKLSKNKYKYLREVLVLKTWGNHQFNLELKNNGVAIIWWTNDPENIGGHELKGSWSLEDNVIFLTNLKQFSGSYIITKYNYDFSQRVNDSYFVIILNRKIGAPGWESKELDIKLD